MEKKIDLHTHSLYSSDGELTPKKLVEEAKKAGLSAISLTDHNTMEGVEEAKEAGKLYGVEVVPGIEVDTKYKGYSIHILGYYTDPNENDLFDLLKNMKKKYFELAKKRIERLNELGFNITYHEAKAMAKDVPIGGILAKVIITNGKNNNHPDLKPYLPGGERSDQPYFNFHLDFFTKGKKAYIPFENVPSDRVIEIIERSGGIPILAHPGSAFDPKKKRDVKVIKELIDCGIKGLEAYSTYHNKMEMAVFHNLAHSLDVLSTAGSDFHGKYKPKISLGGVPNNNYDILKRIKKRRRETK